MTRAALEGRLAERFKPRRPAAAGRHREFDLLSRAEREGRLENAADDLPKSFIVCREKTWLSQLAPATLLRRSGLSVAELTKTG